MIHTIHNLQDAEKKTIEESPDVKSGETTVAEEMQTVGHVLFSQISGMMVKILDAPEVKAGYRIIANAGLGEEPTKHLIGILAMACATSAYNAILFYDDLLRVELTKQFDALSHFTNNNIADINGIKSACEVFQKKIGEIEKKLKLDDVMTEVSKNGHVG